MKTCTSRNIDIQYWQNTPNRNTLYQYNKTASHKWKIHVCKNMGFKSIAVFLPVAFWVSSASQKRYLLLIWVFQQVCRVYITGFVSIFCTTKPSIISGHFNTSKWIMENLFMEPLGGVIEKEWPLLASGSRQTNSIQVMVACRVHIWLVH